MTTEENLTGFADGDQVSDWAVSAMNWAVGQGIVNGKGNSTLDPQGTASRAEVAKMLMVYLELSKQKTPPAPRRRGVFFSVRTLRAGPDIPG